MYSCVDDIHVLTLHPLLPVPMTSAIITDRGPSPEHFEFTTGQARVHS